MRELSVKALLYMDGQSVIVKDLEYDAYDQICTLNIEKVMLPVGKKYKEFPKTLNFSNDEFTFEYDLVTNQCVNGEFKVFSLRD